MLKLELSVEEINLVLSSLSKKPFEEVSELIAKIRSQAIPQLEEPKKEEEKVKKVTKDK